MGNKYGSIHIKTKLPLPVPDMIINALGDESVHTILKSRERLEKLNAEHDGKNKFVRDMLAASKIFSLSAIGRDFFAIITEDWISIYNEMTTFQTIKNNAEAFAQVLFEPIVYASNFDDDILVFGAYCQGEFVTSGMICEDENIFDLTNKSANMAALRRVLGEGNGIPSKMPTDIYEMEDILSDAMGVPLNIFEEFVYSDPEHYEKVEERYGVRVYRKIDCGAGDN